MSLAARVAALVARQAGGLLCQQAQAQVLPALATGWLKQSAAASFHSSPSSWQATVAGAGGAVTKPEEKYAHLADKDIWDEAWAYEPRFGTEDNPIQVPALLGERIIGVTDPEDDTLVIWGIIREGEPPKQLVAGGEFFVLRRVERVEKVGDKLNIPLTPGH